MSESRQAKPAFRDFSLRAGKGAPPGYPAEAAADGFVETAPEWEGAEAWAAGYEARKADFLSFWAARPAPASLKAPYYELPRLAAGLPVHEGILEAGLNYIEGRGDCSDFLVHAYLRALLDPKLSERLRSGLKARAEEVLLGFKYWPDEPGIDDLCTWTENHQILYASAALVLGSAFPDAVFGNSGRTGSEQAARARPRVDRWLDLRFRTGFSEWLSNVYYDEDLAALLTLTDFADPATSRRAGAVVDLILLDLASHSCKGVFGSTHGRSYGGQKKDARLESTTDVARLAFGFGCRSGHDSMAAIPLALSRAYAPPAALGAVASPCNGPAEIRQRMGIRVDEAGRWGLGYDDPEDGMALLSLEAYNHPKTIDLTFRLFDEHNWWDNRYFAPFARYRAALTAARRLGLLPLAARALRRDIDRNSREEANLYTYRTPEYSLSSVQDWNFRRGGDQQAAWQATLGPGAVCFTTHPGREADEPSPGYWTGDGSLPRVAQYKNVLVAVYEIDRRPGLYLGRRLPLVHAWLSAERFDEIAEASPWVFARRGAAYLALAADKPLSRKREGEGEGQPNELVAEGWRSTWVCRLGREADDGSFADFRRAISGAGLSFRRGRAAFDDPAHGAVEFGSRGPFMVGGRAVPLGDYPRYDAPWAQAPFPSGEVRVEWLGQALAIRPEGRGPTPASQGSG